MFPHDYESAQANAGHLVEEEKGIGGEGGGDGGGGGKGGGRPGGERRDGEGRGKEEEGGHHKHMTK